MKNNPQRKIPKNGPEAERGGRERPSRSPVVILGVLRAIDVAITVGAAALAFVLRHGSLDMPGAYYVVIAAALVLSLNVMQTFGLYRFEILSNLREQVHKILLALPTVILLLLAFGFFTKTSDVFSRVWVAVWFAMTFVGMVAARLWLGYRIAAWRAMGMFNEKAVVIGAGRHGARLIRHIQNNPQVPIDLVGIFDDRKTRVPKRVEGVEVLGTTEDLVAYVRANKVHQVLVALPWTAEGRLLECMMKLKTVPVDVRLAPDTIGYHLHDRTVSHIGGIPVFDVFSRPLSGWNAILKDIEDRLLAALILVLIAPLMATIALAIRLDSPGPVLFRQKRYGFNNNVFDVYKFRTMYHDRGAEHGIQQATRGDSRVTRIGAILRRTSLDELPQFINVLEGTMSIIGPRPHAVAHNQQYATIINDYLGRHRVKPGITGWAQVNGLRGETETLEKMQIRVEYDLYYIENWSIWFDLRILLQTLALGFMNRHAY